MGLAFAVKDAVTGENYSFDPNRCVERFYPRMVELLIAGCMEKSWESWFAKDLKDQGVTEETLLKCLRAFSVFCDLSLDPDIKDPREALNQAEFFSYPEAAQKVILAKVGQLCAGAFWAGIRHSVMVGVVPSPIRMMDDAAAKLERFISERWNDASKSDAGPACAGPSAGEISPPLHSHGQSGPVAAPGPVPPGSCSF